MKHHPQLSFSITCLWFHLLGFIPRL